MKMDLSRRRNHQRPRRHRIVLVRLIGASLVLTLLRYPPFSSSSVLTSDLLFQSSPQAPCAILLYGLPRAFQSLVLPSLIQNVIVPNQEHRCDYFVHYHLLDHEETGRSGAGGALNVQEIHLLKHEVEKRGSRIQFSHTLDADFWEQYQPLLDKINDTQDGNGKPLYFPWKARTYHKPATTNNIIKMWHSIQKAWNMATTPFSYQRLALLRSDVLYVTPLHVMDDMDRVVVPGFARYPVSDRMAIGPPAGIQVWAAERFARMDQHVQNVLADDPGWGLHSERFVENTLFPAIRQVLESEDAVLEHPTVCFLRVRADESVWISDCHQQSLPSVGENLKKTKGGNMTAIVEGVLGRPCHGPVKRLTRIVRSLNCSLA